MQADNGRRDRATTDSPKAEPRCYDRVRYSAATSSRSAAYRETIRLAELFARDRAATILIEGEPGTGKTLLARRLYQLSPRSGAPYLECDLGTLDDSLASDVLFGHVPGAFTGARTKRDGLVVSATGGTIFLDELAKATLHVQQKLLRLIEYHVVTPIGSDRSIGVDVRIIAATNASLDQVAAQGLFLPDLYDRLKVFRIKLPSLRERAEDIPCLVEECLARRAPDCGYVAIPRIEPALMSALQRAEWSANVRGLDGCIHRLLLEAQGAPVLTLEMCSAGLANLIGFKAVRKAPLQIEQARNALALTGGHVLPAARLLGVSRWTVDRVLKKAAADADRRDGHESV